MLNVWPYYHRDLKVGTRYEKKTKVSNILFSTFFISSQFGKKLNACYDVHEAIVKFMTPGSEQIYNIGKIY